MTCLRGPLSGILSFLLGLGLTGCFLSGENQLDEKKEPHFLTGQNRRSNMDYQGAIVAFEKALAINPKSASAHLELAVLFDQEVNDYPAAIYHYERHLRLRPPAKDDKRIRERIDACKGELAKTVSIGPVSPVVQAQLERLRILEIENAELKHKVAYYETGRQTSTNRAHSVTSPSPPNSSSSTPQLNREDLVPSNPTVLIRQPAPVSVKAHAVRANETPTSIAKKYGVSVTALMAANPGVEARRLRIGQKLNVPVP